MRKGMGRREAEAHLRAWGREARAHDLAPDAVARVAHEARAVLARRAGTEVAPRWVWRPVLAAAAGLTLILGVAVRGWWPPGAAWRVAGDRSCIQST